MAESSSSNTDLEKLISFQLTQASKLFRSIASLRDFEFNPKGVAMVDITEQGFEITVRNAETQAAGYLFFKSSGLINFHCSKPIVGKMINVTRIFERLVNDATHHIDDDIVIIVHLNGSNSLTFIHGNDEYNAELSEMDEKMEKIPNITLFCEAVLTAKNLRQIIQRLNVLGISEVSVDISERLVGVFVGEKDPWIYKYVSEKNVGTRGMEPGKMHHAEFILPHLEALWKASYLAPCFLMCFLSEPADNVMIRFCLRELGDLAFIFKAEKIISNADEVAVTLNMLQFSPDFLCPYMTI